jgi:hypothetical protein
VAELAPTWAVLRPAEWQLFNDRHSAAARCYVQAATFGEPHIPVVELNGLAKWNQDWTFTVYRRDRCGVQP